MFFWFLILFLFPLTFEWTLVNDFLLRRLGPGSGNIFFDFLYFSNVFDKLFDFWLVDLRLLYFEHLLLLFKVFLCRIQQIRFRHIFRRTVCILGLDESRSHTPVDAVHFPSHLIALFMFNQLIYVHWLHLIFDSLQCFFLLINFWQKDLNFELLFFLLVQIFFVLNAFHPE